jgi:hypothetical protein
MSWENTRPPELEESMNKNAIKSRSDALVAGGLLGRVHNDELDERQNKTAFSIELLKALLMK